MSNWSGLIEELLSLICKRVDSFKELSAFGRVCSAWRRVAVEQNLGHPFLPFPWLMLAENKNDDDDHRDFYSITEAKTYSFDLPELKGKKCMETKGWIVTVSENREMNLVHPLKHIQIPLPHQNTSELYAEPEIDPMLFVWRVVLSSPPDPKNERDCVLVILHGVYGHIGFCRPGDKVWTLVEKKKKCYESVEYYRGKFYFMTNGGAVWEYDLIGSNDGSFSPRRIAGNLKSYIRCKHPYLVESAGSLLVVFRNGVQYGTKDSNKFCVLEIDVEQGKHKELSSLGTRVIFLGHSASLSVDTICYPELIPNSIYFTDDCHEKYLNKPERRGGGGSNMGVYSLEDKTVQPHYKEKSLSFVCPPIWTFLTS